MDRPTFEPSPWREFIQYVIDHYDDELTDWERDFCRSFLDRGFPVPTPKQEACLMKMARTLGVDPPD